MYNVRLVCEGPTDVEVFKAVLDAHLGGAEYQLTMLQPDGSLYGGAAGPHGGGWKGVRGWCRAAAEAGGVEAVGALGPDVDLLVIHVDADIAFDDEHKADRPCPPPDATVRAVEAIVLGWLGVAALPERVLMWIPSMATEAWVLRALFPTLQRSASCLTNPAPDMCVECLLDPAQELLGRSPKLVRRRQGDLKKITRAYMDARHDIATQWDDLKDMIWTARMIDQGLQQWIPSP